MIESKVSEVNVPLVVRMVCEKRNVPFNQENISYIESKCVGGTIEQIIDRLELEIDKLELRHFGVRRKIM